MFIREAAKKVLLLKAGPFFGTFFSNIPMAIKLEGGRGFRP